MISSIEMNCANCMNCKVFNKWTKLKCSRNLWAHNKKKDKFVRLTEHEIRVLQITPRNLLREAERCPEFDYMGS